MTRAALIAALFGLAACTAPDSDGAALPGSDTHQQPSNLTPGVHIGGYATVGAIRRY